MPVQRPPCPACKGTGQVPRVARKLADGETPDPLDIQSHFPAMCDTCGGSGWMTEAQARAAQVAETKKE